MPSDTPHATADFAAVGAALFERYSVYEGAAFRNHCLRVAALGGLLAQRHGIAVQPGALELVSYAHDLGLLVQHPAGPSYMHRSLSILRQSCAPLLDERGGGFGWSARELEELLLLNHRVFPPAGASRIAELYRRAVWVEHSRGLRRYGLAHSDVQSVFARWPRLNLDGVLLDFGRRTLRREPLSLVRGVFFGTHPPAV